MMGSKPAKAMRVKTLQSHWAIGDPDALPIEIHLAGCGATDSSSGRVPGKSGR